MSNNSTYIVNLCADPEVTEVNGKELARLRCADNTGQKYETRFFNATVGGFDVETAKRLTKGDQVVLAGQLVLTTYKAKKAGKGVKKGDTVKADEMPFAKLVQVVKSATFFNKVDEEPTGDAEPDDSTDDADDPLAGV